MSNSEADAAQKQWEARNSDRRDTFEGVKYGTRTGEVRTIEYQETAIRSIWQPASQDGTDGVLSDDPAGIRHAHVWPSDVSPPAEGALVLAEVQQIRDYGELGTGNGNGHEPVDLDSWTLYTYTPAADGD